MRYGKPLAVVVEEFDHEQCAVDWSQWMDALSRKGWSSRNIVLPSEPSELRNRRRVDGGNTTETGTDNEAEHLRKFARGEGNGTKGKAKGDKGGKINFGPAHGGFSANRTYNRIVRILDPAAGTYSFHEGYVITLPGLLLSLGDSFHAEELYHFYCMLPLVSTKRQHPWGTTDRHAAALLRKRDHGHFGFGR